MDAWLHRVKCRLHKSGHERSFRVLHRLCMPICRRVESARSPCLACGGAGWVIDCDPTKTPRALEIMPCLIPDCEASGTPVALVSFWSEMGLAHEARHPASGVIMSVST